jgi:hypothetical protein
MGHHDPLGTPSTDAELALRHRVRAAVQAAANERDQTIEIFATHPRVADWIVDTVEPKKEPG